ncbi:MAG: TolB family protein, partial [Chloroflexota bacterium]
HLDQLWVSQPDGQGRRLVYQLPATSGEQDLVDLSWSPDGRHLVAFARQRPVGGGNFTRVFLVDSAGQAVKELVTVPSEVVAGSSTWDAEGQRVGFLTRSGDATSLFVIGLAQLDARYLADVSRSDSQVAPFAPVAWAPQGAGFVYSAPDQLQSSSSWLASQPSPALFAVDEIFGKPHRLGASEVETPTWLDQQALVGLARKPHDGPLVVREVKRSGATSDVAELPFKANAYAARWDVRHGQAVVAIPGGAGGFSTSSDYWLVQLQGTAR